MIMTSSAPKALTLSLCANHANDRVLITLTPPDKPQGSTGKRSAVDICCVLDVSGSMAANADIKSKRMFPTPHQPGQFTVLDIVKHSVRTIVTSMQEDDRIAIVTFSDHAQVIADFTPMNAANKVEILDSIDKLTPLNSTNLWDGLETGMDLILAAQTPPPKLPWYKQVQHNRYTSLFLLTDGMPNVNPPNGHIPALRSYLDMRSPSSAHSFTIHTFGFGYSIDTPLLLDIAKTGGGRYNFIPDVGMVGTVFVNSVASTYAVYAQHVKIDIQIPTARTGIQDQKNYKMELKGKIESTKTTRGIRFDSADIQYGQPKHYVLDITPSFTTSLHAFASYRAVTSSTDVLTDIAVLSSSRKATKEELVEIEYRATAFTVASVLLNTTSENRATSISALKEIESRLTSQEGLSEHPYAAALARDVGGEALASVATPANYERWGKHYGKSYAHAHQQQHCQNYKDSGLQSYGISPMIQRERDTLVEAFHSIPAPTPSMQVVPKASGASPMVFSPQSAVNSVTLSIPSISQQSTPSLNDSLGRTPSPTYREILGQYSQYATDPSSSYLSDRSATLTRLKGFFSQRRLQQQSPLNNYGSNTHSSLGDLAGLQLVSPAMQDDALITGVPPAPTTEAFSPSPMSPYYDPGAPCFTGECLVRTPEDPAPIRVDKLRRGIAVQTPKGPRNVAAVVRTQVHRQEIKLCRLGDLVITPWHPVKLQEEGGGGIARWVFPAYVVEPELVSCDAIYSVLLERGDDADSEPCDDAHSICISDVWTVTLGHGITTMNSDDVGVDVDVRGHRFLGDYDKVVRDLSQLNGFFEDGVVRCQGVRRGSDGMVCGFVGERNFEGRFRPRALNSMNMVSV